MKSYNFIIGPTDTDSISFCKPGGLEFSEEERIILLNEINSLSPEFIEWENDGYYKTCLALKAKNYILYDGEEKIIKGSAFKTSSKEIAMKAMMTDIVDAILNDKLDILQDIYKQYVKEAINVTDISRWAQKKSITEPVLKCRGYEKYTKEQLKAKEMRPNETNIWDAVKNEELVQQGDKVYIYPAILSTETVMEPVIRKNRKTGEMEHKGEKAKEVITYGLKMTKYWDKQDHDVEQLVKRVYDTIKIFSTVLDMDQFINYALVKNKELWKSL